MQKTNGYKRINLSLKKNRNIKSAIVAITQPNIFAVEGKKIISPITEMNSTKTSKVLICRMV